MKGHSESWVASCPDDKYLRIHVHGHRLMSESGVMEKRRIQNQPVGKNDLQTACRLASSEHCAKGAATTFSFE